MHLFNHSFLVASFLSLSAVAPTPRDYVAAKGPFGTMVKYLFDRKPECGFYNVITSGFPASLDSAAAGNQQTIPLSQANIPEMCAKYPNAVHVNVAQRPLIVTRYQGDSDESCEPQLVADLPDYNSNAPRWAEALQLIYGGENGEGSVEACTSERRKSLVQNWTSLWEDSCATGECEGLRFAFRPGDNATATMVFQQLVGISKFCNGNHFQDNDPIRTDCSDAEDLDFCDLRKDYTLGLVQAVYLDNYRPEYVPNHSPHPDSSGCPHRNKCRFGNWDYFFQSRLHDELFDGNCTDGEPPVADFLCLYPRDVLDQFGCINNLHNPSPMNALMDGRDFNLLRSTSDPSDPFPINDSAGNQILQSATVYLNANCISETDVLGLNTSRQIGCLVDQVQCSIGFGTKGMLSHRAVEEWVDDIPRGLSPFHCRLLDIERVTNTAAEVGAKSYFNRSYPLVEKFYMSSGQGIPSNAAQTALDCDSVRDSGERDACRCFFDDIESLGYRLEIVGLTPNSGGPTVSRCPL